MSVSSTTLRPPSAIYREEQNFAWWIYVLLIVMAVVGVGSFLGADPPEAARSPGGWGLEVPLVLAIALVLPSVLILGVLHMTTQVTPTQCQVWLGWIPTYRTAVPLATIVSIEIVEYRPIADYGGWGIRRGRDGERVLNARGNRGVRLTLSDGARLLIGSQKPENLALAIDQARRAAV